MILTRKIKDAIDKSVLCWLATVSSEGIPNVSPKEVFQYYGNDKIIIANIASPQSKKNIKYNENVCVSFIDILIQKGFQLKGKARVIDKMSTEFEEMKTILLKITNGDFPFSTIFEVTAIFVKPIIAPKYILYPKTTEKEQVKSAKQAYGFNE